MKNNTPPSAMAGVEQTSRYQPERYWQRSRYILRAPRLSANERLVLLAISDHLGDKRSAWPSADRLAKMTGLARRTVLRTIKALDASGRIAVVRSTGRANRYRMDWARINPFHDLRECQSDTRATESPVTQSHQCQPDTPPVTQSHPTRDTESPEADQRSGSEKRIKNNTPQPPKGEPVDKSTKASTVDNSVEPVDKSTKADPLKALWQQLEAIRTEHKPGARQRSLTKARRRALRARAEEHSPADVLLVCRWLWTSEHSRAVFLRTQGHEDAILRASKFDAYLDMAREPQTPSQQPAGSKTGADTSGATNEAGEAWGRVLKALRIHGPKAPGVGTDPWVFSNREALADAYTAGILAAAKEAQGPVMAWRLLYSEGGEQNRLWQRRRFEGAFNASIRSARLRGAA